MAKKVSAVSVGSGSEDRAVSRGGAGGATRFLRAGACAAGLAAWAAWASVAGAGATAVPAAAAASGCVAAGTLGREAATGGAAGTDGRLMAGVAAAAGAGAAGAGDAAAGAAGVAAGGVAAGGVVASGAGDSSGEDWASADAARPSSASPDTVMRSAARDTRLRFISAVIRSMPIATRARTLGSGAESGPRPLRPPPLARATMRWIHGPRRRPGRTAAASA